MIKKILRFPFSKRGRIYTATLLTLFLLGNAYVKHKFHEKAVEELHPVHTAQLITYLKLSGIKYGLLINFNVRSLKEGIRIYIV